MGINGMKMKAIRDEEVRAVRELSERGLSCAMIAKCMGIPESAIRYLQRRE